METLEQRHKHLQFVRNLDKKVTQRQQELETEFIENVLVKEVTPGGDKVFVVSKLPKQLLFRAAKEMVPMGQRQDFAPTGQIVDELLPGIERSQTKDDGFVFFQLHEALARLQNIDRYIRGLWPHTRALPRREYYAMSPGDPMSPPKHLSDILRVELLTSPPADGQTSAALGQPSASKELIDAVKMQVKAEMLAEKKAEQKAKMAKVRASKQKPKS